MHTASGLITAWSGDRVHLTVHLDHPRHERIKTLVEEYSAMIGRPVSISLLLMRGLDLLDQHLEDISDDNEALLMERLTLLGTTRLPLSPPRPTRSTLTIKQKDIKA